MKPLLLAVPILLFTLAACGDGVAEQVTPSPALAAGEKIVGETLLPWPTPTQEPAAAPAPLPAGDPAVGEKIFSRTCATCHGQDLSQSELVATHTDQELAEFIKVGGAPGGPLVMPPRGGSPSLTDENLVDLAAYLRSLQK